MIKLVHSDTSRRACTQHKLFWLTYVCIDEKCTTRKLVCCECIRTRHLQHKCVPLEVFYKLLEVEFGISCQSAKTKQATAELCKQLEQIQQTVSVLVSDLSHLICGPVYEIDEEASGKPTTACHLREVFSNESDYNRVEQEFKKAIQTNLGISGIQIKSNLENEKLDRKLNQIEKVKLVMYGIQTTIQQMAKDLEAIEDQRYQSDVVPSGTQPITLPISRAERPAEMQIEQPVEPVEKPTEADQQRLPVEDVQSAEQQFNTRARTVVSEVPECLAKVQKTKMYLPEESLRHALINVVKHSISRLPGRTDHYVFCCLHRTLFNAAEGIDEAWTFQVCSMHHPFIIGACDENALLKMNYELKDMLYCQSGMFVLQSNGFYYCPRLGIQHIQGFKLEQNDRVELYASNSTRTICLTKNPHTKELAESIQMVIPQSNATYRPCIALFQPGNVVKLLEEHKIPSKKGSSRSKK